jgi:hypothetical protein
VDEKFKVISNKKENSKIRVIPRFVERTNSHASI